MEEFTMAQTDIRSLQQIKRETEQARAGLTNTVEQLRTSVTETASDLRQRIQPDAIKAEMAEYIKSRGEQLLSDVTAAARRNPMQAVAIGASIAYPLLRVARNIPVPVLMVGAGIFFAGSKTGKAITQKASDVASELSDEVNNRAHDLRDQVGESASAMKTYAVEQFDRARDAVVDGTARVDRAADAAGAALTAGLQKLDRGASAVADTVSARANGLRDDARVQDVASEATSIGRRATGVELGLDAATAVPDKASRLAEVAGEAISRTFQQNPLLVSSLGLLVGALIASALPPSAIEDDLIGDASTAVRRGAQSAVSQSLEAAKSAAREVVDEAVGQAETVGLTSESIGEAADDLGRRVRRVAESALSTAFDPDKNNPQQSYYGETDHG
jgi:uncharacterized phage infection (PIP) family protein YhgE